MHLLLLFKKYFFLIPLLVIAGSNYSFATTTSNGDKEIGSNINNTITALQDNLSNSGTGEVSYEAILKSGELITMPPLILYGAVSGENSGDWHTMIVSELGSLMFTTLDSGSKKVLDLTLYVQEAFFGSSSSISVVVKAFTFTLMVMFIVVGFTMAGDHEVLPMGKFFEEAKPDSLGQLGVRIFIGILLLAVFLTTVPVKDSTGTKRGELALISSIPLNLAQTVLESLNSAGSSIPMWGINLWMVGIISMRSVTVNSISHEPSSYRLITLWVFEIGFLMKYFETSLSKNSCIGIGGSSGL